MTSVTTGPYNAPPDVGRFERLALLVGVAFIIILAIGALLDPPQFFHSYVFAFSFWAGISVGSLALLMLQHLTGGGWGLVIRRVLEAATRTLPLVLILFVPIVLGAHRERAQQERLVGCRGPGIGAGESANTMIPALLSAG